MKHYVYKLENPKTGKYYFGSRSCRCKVEDDNYMGSMVAWKPDKSKLKKTILKDDFKTRDEAMEYEALVILEHINDELNENYHIPGKGFHTAGMNKGPLSDEHKKKLSEIGRGRKHSKETIAKLIMARVGCKHSEETKQKLRDQKIGTTHSEETREKMSKSHTGKVKTEKHRQELSKSLSGKPKSKKHKQKLSEVHKIPVIQYDKDMNVIQEWDGIIDVVRELGINHISSVCKGKRKTAGGYIWKYKE